MTWYDHRMWFLKLHWFWKYLIIAGSFNVAWTLARGLSPQRELTTSFVLEQPSGFTRWGGQRIPRWL